jgi:hypothetical protein
MPPRNAPKEQPIPSARKEWQQAFEAELTKLRPHLDTYGGRLTTRISNMAWAARRGETPVASARAWHKANPIKTISTGTRG